MRPERTDFRLERADFRLERADLRPEREDIRPERADCTPEKADFRPERAWGDKQTNNERINKQTEVPLCSTGLHPLWGRCPKTKKITIL